MSSVVKAAVYLADRAAEHASPDAALTGDMLCPLCRLPLARETYELAGVELDRCDEHGAWFDCGELQRVSRGSEEFRAKWRATLAEQEQRSMQDALNQQLAEAEEGATRRFFRALGALLRPADHGGFEEKRE